MYTFPTQPQWRNRLARRTYKAVLDLLAICEEQHQLSVHLVHNAFSSSSNKYCLQENAHKDHYVEFQKNVLTQI
ncbi:hypothetical protein T05_4789 [Trichinella murrelli]|uniref:Uncharacterized protein n=1 Tax=Trichinella murrelli TaxID=144512 RepID=A0A0V0TX80_9BILA|nr:hypothetical protein T05_4789 [Trichinella murrelli]